MNLPNELVASSWLWLAHAGFWPLLLVALRHAPWQRLGESEALHVWLGTTVAVLLLWSIKAGIAAGLTLHLLGTTLLTLMFGWSFALLSATLVVLGTTLNGASGWEPFALNVLVTGALPVTVSYVLFRLVERYLPNHFFVYIFVSAFAGGAVSMAAVGLVSTLVLGLSQAYAFDHLSRFYLPYYLMMVFPEAFLTGMLMSLFVVYRPRWVRTFSDERYLVNK